MKANVVHLVLGNTSENAEFSSGIPCTGRSNYQQSQAESEHAELLFSLFERHLCGTRALAPKTVIMAMGAIRGFASWAKTPPWHWTPEYFADFITERVREKDIGLGRQAFFITYLRSFQKYVFESRGLMNDIYRKFGVNFQRFINEENSIPIRRKAYERKKSITPLTAEKSQNLLAQFDIEIQDAKMYGKKTFRPMQRNKTMVSLLLSSGLRVNELVNIRMGDFQADLARPEFGNYALITVVHGKGRKARVVRMFNPQIKDVLDWYIDHVRPTFLKATTKDTSLLFLSERGEQLGTEQVRRSLDRVAKLAGIETRLTPHVLRHSYATQMKEAIGPESLQRQLGHVHLSTTLGTYYHQDPEKIGRDIEIGITNITNAIDAITLGIEDEDHH